MLAEKLVALGFKPIEDFVVQDDGDGAYLREWRSQAPRPTEAEIEAAVIPTPNPVDAVDIVLLKIAFNHENRIRALEGKQAVSLAQFKVAVKALL